MEFKIEWFGYVGGVLTSVGFIPQIIKGLRTKRMKDVSLWQYVITITGMALWLTYGLIIKDMPLIAANTFSMLCASIILVLWTKYKND